MVQRVAGASRPPMLVPRAHDAPPVGTGGLSSTRTVATRVALRVWPRVLEATIIPAVLFYAFLTMVGAGAAMISVLVWTYGAVLRRRIVGQPVPGLLLLAVVTLTARTTVALLSGSTFIYFLQPVATTVALGIVFIGSVIVGRPIIARLANDFCPIDIDVANRPMVVQLFARLTLLWAAVHFVTAATTFTMLVSLPSSTFVLLKTGVCLAITVGAVVLTVGWALRIARRENLAFAIAD